MSVQARRQDWMIHCVKCNDHFTVHTTTQKAERLRDAFDEGHEHDVRLKPAKKIGSDDS